MLKNTNIIRSIDDMGRLMVPRQIRKDLGINFFDDFVVLLDKENGIVAFKALDSKLQESDQ